MRLKNRVAIVTGGGRGLGTAIVRRLAEEGAAVVIAGRTEAPLRDMARRIEGEGGRSLALPTDVSDEDQVKRLVAQTVERFGGVDILVNNAGRVGMLGRFMDFPASEWLEAYKTNLMGPLFCSREALKVMMPRKGGAIVNIGSIASVTGFEPSMPYVASKAALNALTIDLARIASPAMVRVNALLLGPVNPASEARAVTSSGQAPPRDRLWSFFGMSPPAGEMLQPAEIAATVAYLASDEACSVTGQLIQMVTRLRA